MAGRVWHSGSRGHRIPPRTSPRDPRVVGRLKGSGPAVRESPRNRPAQSARACGSASREVEVTPPPLPEAGTRCVGCQRAPRQQRASAGSWCHPHSSLELTAPHIFMGTPDPRRPRYDSPVRVEIARVERLRAQCGLGPPATRGSTSGHARPAIGLPAGHVERLPRLEHHQQQGDQFPSDGTDRLGPEMPVPREECLVVVPIQAPLETPPPREQEQLAPQHRPAALRLALPAGDVAARPLDEIHPGELQHLAEMDVVRGSCRAVLRSESGESASHR